MSTLILYLIILIISQNFIKIIKISQNFTAFKTKKVPIDTTFDTSVLQNIDK